MALKKNLIAVSVGTLIFCGSGLNDSLAKPFFHQANDPVELDVNIQQLTDTFSEKRLARIEQYHEMISDHLQQNFSVIRTTRILTAHYPQDVNEIFIAAVQHEPRRITHISRAIIRSEPALTTDVLSTALQLAPEKCEELVAMAIEAEPAYIDDIVSIAAQYEPEQLDSILRVAITAKPDLSGSVVRSAATSSPQNFFSAMVNTVTNLPQTTQNVFVAVRDFFTGQEQGNEVPLPNTSPEQWNAFIAQAKSQGVTKQEMDWFKEQGYITEQQLTAVYNNEP